jgi:hypothetical protein
MQALYNHAIQVLDQVFRKLEALVPPPQKMAHGDSWVFRYKEQTIHQAIIQKLARVISGLQAARLLCEHGWLQEQSAIQRTLDEFHEDINFLALGILNDDITPLHREYLDAFYKEEFDPVTVEALLDRPMARRQKIRAYLSRVPQRAIDPSSSVTLLHTLSSANSGYVHGASPHIMDMFGGFPPQFQIHGMTGTPRHEAHGYDLYNYFFRAICDFSIAAKVFGDDELCKNVNTYLNEFDRLSGRNDAVANRHLKEPDKTHR